MCIFFCYILSYICLSLHIYTVSYLLLYLHIVLINSFSFKKINNRYLCFDKKKRKEFSKLRQCWLFRDLRNRVLTY